MTLLGCAHRAETPAPEPVVIVQTIKEVPPSELTRCPTLPAGLPTTGEAVLRPDWRQGIGRMARSHGALLDQLTRLILWNTGIDCAEPSDSQ